MEFFNAGNVHLYISIGLSFINAAMLCFVGYKFLQIIQLSGYKLQGYFEWLKDTKAKYVSRVFMISLLSVACILVTNAVLDAYSTDSYWSYLGLVFYFYFSIIFISNMYSAPKKTPLKNTHRMNRLTVCLFILCLGVTFGLIAVGTEYLESFRFGCIAITPLLLPLIVVLAYITMFPIEVLIRARFIARAKKKLKKLPELVKIGITGSYGKTSCKYILNTMLSQKYNVCMSPHSFNTPMGITKVVLNYLRPEHEILIAEMGATNVGDIRFLCGIVPPQYGILTAIGNQHLHTFKTYENIMKTKNELIESIRPGGFAVFNGENEGAKLLYKKAKVDKGMISLKDEEADAYAKDITVNSQGVHCTIVVEGESIECQTTLLGEHSLQNILMCALLAHRLGVTGEQISQAILQLKAVPHRLELIESSNGVTVLDDAYNASVQGYQSALKVLSLFEGRKIIMTPGLVELGTKEKEENFEFGKAISKVADICMLVNKSNEEAIRLGLIEGGMKEENIVFSLTLAEAQLKLKDILKSGDTLLIENDLPDNYT